MNSIIKKTINKHNQNIHLQMVKLFFYPYKRMIGFIVQGSNLRPCEHYYYCYETNLHHIGLQYTCGSFSWLRIDVAGQPTGAVLSLLRLAWDV